MHQPRLLRAIGDDFIGTDWRVLSRLKSGWNIPMSRARTVTPGHHTAFMSCEENDFRRMWLLGSRPTKGSLLLGKVSVLQKHETQELVGNCRSRENQCD
jgi:hypothetical protein